MDNTRITRFVKKAINRVAGAVTRPGSHTTRHAFYAPRRFPSASRSSRHWHGDLGYHVSLETERQISRGKTRQCPLVVAGFTKPVPGCVSGVRIPCSLTRTVSAFYPVPVHRLQGLVSGFIPTTPRDAAVASDSWFPTSRPTGDLHPVTDALCPAHGEPGPFERPGSIKRMTVSGVPGGPFLPLY